MPGAQTLPSRQRARVLDAYRGRGHRNSNLWLVYSVKQDQDLLLHSDRSLVHWLTFLESDPTVTSFVPIPDAVSAQLKVGPAAAMVVERHYSELEVHIIADHTSALSTVETGGGTATVRTITLEELRSRAQLAVRWLKAIGYAGQYRYKDLTPVWKQLTPVCLQRWTGMVNDLINDFPGLERAAIYASLVRAAIDGQIQLDLSSHSLCPSSRWGWAGPVPR
ncbi:hypothetical protein [Massilia sp. YMA4]|uniref:hypothetical protein n=1 Tax=Massilia sp. YMA4 TaxID=1593482 RepID=UPI000DD186E3|nr:hypothetical protein [Massilia sp. YMA4]AXA90818.1 hypothetical protein DPH57_06345 [Massilia sp. YMA4]